MNGFLKLMRAKAPLTVVLLGVAIAAPAVSYAQVAGSSLIAFTAIELRQVTNGWSAKRQIIGQPVFNDANEKIGSVDDIIVAGDKAVSYAIVNAGGFLALTKYDVAIPVSRFELVDDKLILPGATKDALLATPRFEYAS